VIPSTATPVRESRRIYDGDLIAFSSPRIYGKTQCPDEFRCSTIREPFSSTDRSCVKHRTEDRMLFTFIVLMRVPRYEWGGVRRGYEPSIL